MEKSVQPSYEDKNLQAQIQTTKLYSKFDKTLNDYKILRFYTNGVIKMFTSMISQVMEAWNSAEISIPGQNMGVLKKMLNQQLDSFRKTMPLECSYEEIRNEVEYLNSEMNSKINAFEQHIINIHDLAQKIDYRNSFNNDLELEINKLIMNGKLSKNFLNKLSNEVLSPMQSFMNMNVNQFFPNLQEDALPFLQDMKQTALNFTGLINEYKFYSQLREQNVDFPEQDFDFNDIVNQIIEKYTAITLDKDIDLFYKIDPLLPEKIHANRLLIEKLTGSLLDNALNIIYISRNLESRRNEDERIRLKLSILRSENWRATVQISVEHSNVAFPSGRLQDIYSFFSLYSEKDPFASLKLKLIEELIDFLGGSLEILNQNNKSSLSVIFSLDVA